MAAARVVHFEVPFDDADRARAFYRDVFEWSIEPIPDMDYDSVSTGPAGEDGMPSESGYIGGGMAKREDSFKDPVIVLAVDDIDATLQVVEQHGGSTATPKMPVGDMGFAAYFNDSEGNVMGLWQSAT